MREVYLPAIRECLNEDFDLLATEIKTLKLHAGDDDKLRSLLGLKPWEISPLDAVGECRYPSGCAGALSWPPGCSTSCASRWSSRRQLPELQHAVERGEISVAAAADVATLDTDKQREVVARGEREIGLKVNVCF
jgi:hypothetical protein